LDGLKDDGKKATFFVDEKRKDELKALADDLAIVCPLVDGRMKDLGDDQQ
jgi:5'-nucleotidase